MNLKEARLAKHWKQEELASAVGIPRSTLSRIESGHLGVDEDLFARLCDKLDVHPADLVIRRSLPSGGQRKPDARTLAGHTSPPQLMQPEGWTTARRLDELFRLEPLFMDPLLRRFEEWDPFLRAVPSGSPLESLFQLRELDEGGAAPTTISTAQLGFDHWPVANDELRGAAACLRPALCTKDWLCLFQVGVLVKGSYYRLDVLVKHRGCFYLLEIDGGQRNQKRDDYRQKAVGLPTLRIPGREILTGPLLSERLQAHRERGRNPEG